MNIYRVTCIHCSSSLIVHRSETTAFTELAQTMVNSISQLSEETKRLSNSVKLQELDRQWELRVRQLEDVNKHGRRSIPTVSAGVFQSIFIGGFGLAWTAMAFAITSMAPPFGPFIIAKILFPLFGVFFIFFGVAGGINTISKAHQYQVEKEKYLKERRLIADRE